jgi:hypothetical protein
VRNGQSVLSCEEYVDLHLRRRCARRSSIRYVRILTVMNSSSDPPEALRRMALFVPVVLVDLATVGGGTNMMQLPLIRVRHGALITSILSVLVFVTAFFAYYVGAFAAPVVFASSVIIFFRCETWELLRYGIHPCFGALCNMSPFSEIYTVRFGLILGSFLTLGSAIAAIAALVTTHQDWQIALQICCLVFSILCILASVATLVSLQNALQWAGLGDVAGPQPEDAPPPTHPNFYTPQRVAVQPQYVAEPVYDSEPVPPRQYYVVTPNPHAQQYAYASRSPAGQSANRWRRQRPDPYD